MANKFNELKAKSLNTEISTWQRFISTTILAVMCLGMVTSFWYLYVTIDDLYCYKGFVYMSIVWIIAELTVISYMLHSHSIPRFFRGSVVLVLAFSNIWFGLFIFSLKACGN